MTIYSNVSTKKTFIKQTNNRIDELKKHKHLDDYIRRRQSNVSNENMGIKTNNEINVTQKTHIKTRNRKEEKQ